MPYEPTLQELFVSAFRDSLDESVILLLLLGIVFLFNVKTIARMYPLILSAIVTTITAITFPSFAPIGGIKWHIVLWLPLLSHVGYSLSRHKSNEHSDLHSKWLSFTPHGITILAFVILSSSIFKGYLSSENIDWSKIHESTLLVALFYLINIIAPWRFFSLHKPRDISRVLIYVAVGLFVLRGGVWCYGLFNGSLKERPGSFRLKGVVFAEKMADGWRFHQLQTLIERYWLYPQNPDGSNDSPPIVRDKLLLEDGLQQAESFRQSLFEETAPDLSKATLLARAIVEFQEIAEPLLQDRISLKRFQLDSDNLIDLMKGSEYPIDGRDSLGGFTGRWYGEGDALDIDRHWRPIEYFDPPQSIPGAHTLNLRVKQYCWVGDGFGWNVIASIPAPSQVNVFKDVILGIVYHVKNMDASNIIVTRPHLRLSVGYNQLIEVNSKEVYLEEIIPDIRKSQERLVITGFTYHIENKSLTIKKDAFQASYSREPSRRKKYYELNLKHPLTIP